MVRCMLCTLNVKEEKESEEQKIVVLLKKTRSENETTESVAICSYLISNGGRLFNESLKEEYWSYYMGFIMGCHGSNSRRNMMIIGLCMCFARGFIWMQCVKRE
eukprot:449737_1